MSMASTVEYDSEILIDSALKDFVREIANSSVKGEVLEFIYYNPYSVFTTFSLSRAIKRKEEEIKRVLYDFFKMKILKTVKEAPLPVYIFASDDKLYNLLDRFVKTFNNPEGRGKMVSIIYNK